MINIDRCFLKTWDLYAYTFRTFTVTITKPAFKDHLCILEPLLSQATPLLLRPMLHRLQKHPVYSLHFPDVMSNQSVFVTGSNKNRSVSRVFAIMNFKAFNLRVRNIFPSLDAFFVLFKYVFLFYCSFIC